MDLSFGPEYDDFRSDVVNFLNNNSDKAPKGGDLRGEQAKDWQKLLIENGYTELVIKSSHSLALDQLPPIHKDPFDSMLVTQVVFEGMLLLTADSVVAQYPGPIRLV